MHSLNLSKADSKVLRQVFDPESGPSQIEVIIDPSLPEDPRIRPAALVVELKAREKAAIALVEGFEISRGSPAQKESVFNRAHSLLDHLIQEYPDYASAYNNRAQLRRWRFGDRSTLCGHRQTSDAERSAAAIASVADLKKSIALASPGSPQGAISPAQGRLLGQAYTQLGALYHAAGKDRRENEESRTCPGFEAWTAEHFEDEASRMLYLGGVYGNEVAKALAVHTNPHAKLCSGIVREAVRKELAAA